LADAPERLYYQGRWNRDLFSQCLAVVGTRQMTGYGKQMTEALVGPVAAAGITIVSGFMYGVDAAAHQAALDAGGRTIAVMPCGIGLIHPSNQEGLHARILRKGLVLSEYEGSSPPLLWKFPRRNRIVAGLCQATLVIEGGENSGSLITAALAKKYGRKVFTVPGAVTRRLSLGSVQLLREGAAVAARPDDVLAYYGVSLKHAIPGHDSPGGSGGKGKLSERIMSRLYREPAEADELARELKVSPAVVGAELSMLQLQGDIVETEGRYETAFNEKRGGPC